jgi:hypothetical protein
MNLDIYPNQWCIVDNLQLQIIQEFKFKHRALSYYSMINSKAQYGRYSVMELEEALEGLRACREFGITPNETHRYLEEGAKDNMVIVKPVQMRLLVTEHDRTKLLKKSSRRKKLERSLSLQLPKGPEPKVDFHNRQLNLFK